MLHVVIMAGGGGTRLWPLSTPDMPKQFMKVMDNRSMIEMTFDRIRDLVPAENRWIITIANQAPQLRSLNLDVPTENIIEEPVGRNTAPCIGLSALKILEKDPEAVLAVLPADHLIRDIPAFHACIRDAVEAVEKTDAIATIGIEPTRPETGYGYIQATNREVTPNVVKVASFKEKPDAETAEAYLKTGEYLWNSGMFIWTAKRISDDLKKHLPAMFETLQHLVKLTDSPSDRIVYDDLYKSIDPVSIDYGVIEHATDVLMVRGRFDWSDVGGYDELHRITEKDREGNVALGDIYLNSAKGCYVRSFNERPIAVIGLENVVVVNTEEGILVCDRATAQKVRGVTEWLKQK